MLERNNRGLGVDATLTAPNKKVLRIDIAGETDISAINVATASLASFKAVTKESVPWLNLARPATLVPPSLAALSGVSPEK